jgi:hypothetical protein
MLTESSFRGSYNYVYTEMKQLFNDNSRGLVDLYYNDLNGLLLTLNESEMSYFPNFFDNLLKIDDYWQKPAD